MNCPTWPQRLRLFFLMIPLVLAPAVQAAECKLDATGTGVVASVRDGRTLLLADGREVRLAAIEVTETSREALRTLAAGQKVRLARLGREEHDRYGRLVAFVFAEEAPQSLQQTLLEAGQARVSARIGDKACMSALLAVEHDARTARRGQWADPNFAPLSSENWRGLEAARGRFALVEGKVLSVREAGATIYVNFGRRWTRDFTVTIPKRQRATFAAGGVDLNRLQGRFIRVRGVVERRGGHLIDVAHSGQIELVE